MRIVLAERRGKRGEGLGNEFFSWAKGWIASQVLDAHLVGPSWGLNARRYYRNFNSSRFDFLLEEALRRLPHHPFTEADYLASGEVDFGRAIESWASARGLSRKNSFIITVNGMYGGYPAIYSARSFLLSKLIGSRDALKNMYEVATKLDRRKLFVAVHMRFGGDFTELQPGESARSKFNMRVPAEWYLWICESLRREFQDHIQFYFFTDRGGPGFDEAVRRFNPGQTRQQGLTECSDLVLMAQADLRVCSVSSYSLVASYLSGGPYLWYEPQLCLRDNLYSLWAHEPAQQLENSPSRRAQDFVTTTLNDGSKTLASLGTAVATGEELSEDLLLSLRQRLKTLDPRTNLLDYGCIPARR